MSTGRFVECYIIQRLRAVHKALEDDPMNTPLMLPIEDFHGVHKPQRSLHQPFLPHLHIFISILQQSQLSLYRYQPPSLYPHTSGSELTVDAQLAVPNHLLDLSLLLQII